ncbi:MAG: DUF389 domain-containing protein [Chloroflexota bacterium]
MNTIEPPSQPTPEPEQEFISARARRRRAQRRSYFPTDEAGRTALYEHLARRTYPSYELFVFALVAGVILGLGFLFNAQALLIFGMLVAPLLTPWIGIPLSVIAGSGRLFIQTLTALFVSSLLIFGSGVLAGLASRTLPDATRTFTEAFTHSRLWWPELAVLTIGAVILTISFVRSEERPYLPSALLAYELLLPLCAAGFGLGSGVEGIWLQGLQVFLVHIVWATFFGILTLFFLRFYPTTFSGAALTGLAIIAILAIVSYLTGFDQWIRIQAGLATPEPASVTQTLSVPSPLPTLTAAPEIPEATAVTLAPGASTGVGVPTQTPSRTPTAAPITPQATKKPTQTSTSTVTAEPTPIIGLIKAAEGGGAFIREKPGGKVLATLANGATVTIVPNDFQEVNGVVWIHVFALVNDVRVEGWMIQSVLVTATPIADWKPSATSALTSTP